MLITQSERLIIRHCQYEDVDSIIELLNTDGWLTFIGDRNVKDKISAKTYIDKIKESYSSNGHGLYTVLNKESLTFLGLCGILKRDYLEHVDIGYALMPNGQGKGYATEAVKAILEYAETILNIKTLCAITLTENIRSVLLLKKLGFNFDKKILPPGESIELDLYTYSV